MTLDSDSVSRKKCEFPQTGLFLNIGVVCQAIQWIYDHILVLDKYGAEMCTACGASHVVQLGSRHSAHCMVVHSRMWQSSMWLFAEMPRRAIPRNAIAFTSAIAFSGWQQSLLLLKDCRSPVLAEVSKLHCIDSKY